MLLCRIIDKENKTKRKKEKIIKHRKGVRKAGAYL